MIKRISFFNTVREAKRLLRGETASARFDKLSFLVAFLWQIVRPFRVWVWVMLSVGALWAVQMSWRPYVLKIILDRTTAGASAAMLLWPTIGFLLLSFSMHFIWRIYDWSWLKLDGPLKRHTGVLLMNRMMRHAHPFFQENASGNQGAKILDIMSGIPDLVRIVSDPFFAHTIALMVAVITIWTVHSWLAVALTLWCIFAIWTSLSFSKQAQPMSRRYAEKRASVLGTMVDLLTNMLNVRFFTSRSQERDVLEGKLSELVSAAQTREWFFLRVFSIQGVSFVLYEGFCMFFLLWQWDKGLVTAGDFALITALNLAIVKYMWSISKDFARFSELLGTVTQGLALIYRPLEIQDKKGAQALQVTSGEIAFHNVRFQYNGTEPLFHNNSVTIHPRQKVALVGYSGGGKTTFINLIMRLFDIQSGVIAIDGQDVRNVTQDSLRRNIGIIPQNPILFHRTLMENIRYGRHDATDEEVIQAAKKAFAHQFIKKMPQGYQSMVGERGLKISGGQRQRIAIARAILKNAPLLILDEATSELDSLTEAEIQKSLKALMKNKTTLVVAHRLSTVLSTDRILVFQDGKIVEDGTHKSLLLKEGDTLYKRLWNMQSGGCLPDEAS